MVTKKSYLLDDPVKVEFRDSLFIHLIGRRGPTSNVHMSYRMFLKHKSAGYKIFIMEDENVNTIDGIQEEIKSIEANNEPNTDFTLLNGVLDVKGEIPLAQNLSSDEEDNSITDDQPEIESEKTYSIYSKTQLKKMDKNTLLDYINTLPEGLIVNDNLDSLDKIELVNLIIENVNK
jgi:hypothetical protein